MEHYGYIYLTTNKVNGKRYIGQHKKIEWDYNYFGSGKLLIQAIKKYGVENFECYPLAWAWKREELNQLEKDYIAHYKPEYNIAVGGEGGCLGDWHRELISKVQKGNKNNLGTINSPEVRKTMGEKNIGNKYTLGYKHSEEAKRKNSEWHKGHTYNRGRKWWTDGSTFKFQKEQPEGFWRGAPGINQHSKKTA